LWFFIEFLEDFAFETDKEYKKVEDLVGIEPTLLWTNSACAVQTFDVMPLKV
jgi:hypothetical protein